MAIYPPPVRVADTAYGIMFWGPAGPESKHDGREFTFNTKSNHSQTYFESGNSVSVTPKCHTERVGKNITKEKDGPKPIAKQILADNGDIAFITENGDLHIKARNVYIETTGADPHGNFMVASSGYINMASGEQTRIIGSKLCLRGECGIDIAGTAVTIKGTLTYGDYPSMFGSLKSLVSGDFSGLLEGIDKACI